MMKRMTRRVLSLVLVFALCVTYCASFGVMAASTTTNQFTLDIEAPTTAQAGDVIDVVITLNDIQQPLCAVEFFLDFDETKLEGVITESGSAMDDFMTVVPMYTLVTSGVEIPTPRYEQICYYNEANGVYECRFLDLLQYPLAKEGETYNGLTNDGDLVVTIPFKVLDSVTSGDLLTFSMVSGSIVGTNEALDSVSGTADTATCKVGSGASSDGSTVTDGAFTLDMTANTNASDSSIIDVVITANNFKQEIDAVEFTLNFDKSLVEGVITENGTAMDAFMTVTPMYTMAISGMEIAASRYEQICSYNASNGSYQCRFMDLLQYTYAKAGETYTGLINDGDLVITIQFKILDGVATGTSVPFSITDAFGTTRGTLISVDAVGSNATCIVGSSSSVVTEDAFTLDMTANTNASDSSIIDVVVTANNFKQEIDAVEFALNFDKSLVAGVITESGTAMDAFMTVKPMYTMSINGMEIPVSRYEQICTYDAANGVYECRFLDIEEYSYAKAGETYTGLIDDGDLVIHIQFKILNGVAAGTSVPFSITDALGTTRGTLASVKATGSSATCIAGSGYYLFGYINGANYGCEDDAENMGIYKFEDGQLAATFTQDSYVAVKGEGNSVWYMTNGWLGTDVTSATLYDNTSGIDSNKLYVPGNQHLIFTLETNGDGSVTLSYVEDANGHSWTEATCTDPMTCVTCGATSGSALGHDWEEANCVDPKTCNICGAIEGTELGHNWEEATCTDPMTCATCGFTSGSTLGHDWEEANCTDPKTCNNCGAIKGTALGHDWEEANCVDPKTCNTCGAIEGSALGHNWKEATCTDPMTCATCGFTSGSALGHNWKEATCTDPMTCATCGHKSGSALGHDWVDATCTAAQTCATCGISVGEAMGHSWRAANCTDPSTCVSCGITSGIALGHSWKAVTCTAPKTCTTCGLTSGIALGHNWIAANCTTPQTCTTCGTINGSALGHNWTAATCTSAQTCTTCGTINGIALGHDWEEANCTDPKTCNTCGAIEGTELGHDYESKVTPPTADQQGYTTHTCTRCGDSYVDSYTDVVPQGTSVSGTVVSSTRTTGDVTLELWLDGAEDASYTVTAVSDTYTFEGVAAGTYTMTVSKYGHVTRSYTVTVGTAAVTQNVKICLIGDVNGDGMISVGDVARVYAHVKGNMITDAYALECANVDGGILNIGDVAKIYAHIKGGKQLF